MLENNTFSRETRRVIPAWNRTQSRWQIAIKPNRLYFETKEIRCKKNKTFKLWNDYLLIQILTVCQDIGYF